MLSKSFEYKKWADGRTLDAIAKVNRYSSARAYAFVLQQINHMVIVEDLFRSRLEAKPAPHEATNSELVPDFGDLETRLTASGSWYSKYASGLTPGNTKSVIQFKFTDGKTGSMTVEEILFHVVNHGTYHRGSIAHALDRAGVPHPVDGYGIFAHQDRPLSS